jgi:hypothetical protein
MDRDEESVIPSIQTSSAQDNQAHHARQHFFVRPFRESLGWCTDLCMGNAGRHGAGSGQCKAQASRDQRHEQQQRYERLHKLTRSLLVLRTIFVPLSVTG